MVSPEQIHAAYANEADMLNVALFGQTAKQWREKNPLLDGVTYVSLLRSNNCSY